MSLTIVSSAIFIGSLVWKPNTYIPPEQVSIFKEQVQCLAENVFYEAGVENFEGKLAVAQVTINRANSGKFPGDLCKVVKQKTSFNGITVCQFSWFCISKLPPKDKYRWEESLVVAKKALTEPVAHDMLLKQNALYYHADYVNPGWNLVKVGQIGRHIFYKEKSK